MTITPAKDTGWRTGPGLQAPSGAFLLAVTYNASLRDGFLVYRTPEHEPAYFTCSWPSLLSAALLAFAVSARLTIASARRF
jgi:hypothetical protein